MVACFPHAWHVRNRAPIDAEPRVGEHGVDAPPRTAGRKRCRGNTTAGDTGRTGILKPSSESPPYGPVRCFVDVAGKHRGAFEVGDQPIHPAQHIIGVPLPGSKIEVEVGIADHDTDSGNVKDRGGETAWRVRRR